jgi:hypothetical protein
MRENISLQLQLGEVDVADIQFNPRSRDDIHQLLMGLHHLYTNKEFKDKIFTILQKLTPVDVNPELGAPGMSRWKIFVLGMLRLNINCDYDRLLELANYHSLLRQMLGHTIFNEEIYALQTIKDNIALFTPEILEEINQVIVEAGLKQTRNSKKKVISRCDSFVVKTNVHYPTDINLLYDAIRCGIRDTAKYAETNNLPNWRQYQYNIKTCKIRMRKIQKMKHSNSKQLDKKLQREKQIQFAYNDYITWVMNLISKIQQTLQQPVEPSAVNAAYYTMISDHINHANKQINLIERRIFNNEKIPHKDKIFSIFQPHTEWINKGKAGVPVELGLRVCVVEHSSGYILHHMVMENTTDSAMVVELIKQVQTLYPDFNACSFDKGFHSPSNQIALKEMLDDVILPKKGKRNKAEVEHECNEVFRSAKRKHSAVESGINALEVHGLDKCLDHGIHGFKRYIAIAVVGRNIQKLGSVIIAKQLAKIKLKAKDKNRKRAA